MPENDFEKQVQDLFDGLKLKPSDNVWHNVNERIKKDKKRRRAIFWIPLLLLLLGSAGAYMMWGSSADESAVKEIATFNNTEKKSTENSNNTAQIENNTVAKANADAAKQQNITPAEITNINNDKDGLGSVPLPVSSAKTSKQVTPQATDKYQVETKPDKNTSLPAFNAIKNNVKTKENTVEKDSYNTKEQQEDYKRFTKNINENNTQKGFNGTAVQQYIQAHPFMLSSPGNEKHISTSLQNLLPNIASNSTIRLAKKRSWEFGINAGTGFSKTGSGLSDMFNKLSFEKSLSTADAINLNNLNAGFVASQNNIYLAALPTSATPVKRGLMWNAGVSAKWYVKPKLALTANFQYSYFSTSREVGSYLNNNGAALYAGINTGARYSGYYYGNNAVEYKNKYHLLELPLGIQWQFNKGTKLFPLQLNSGLSAGWLLNSNALHYDKPTGTYYRDESLFNKFQIGLYAGLSAKLLQHSRMPLYIGPYIQYGISNLVKSSSGTQQNLMSVGIKTEWILWKK